MQEKVREDQKIGQDNNAFLIFTFKDKTMQDFSFLV